MKKFLLFAVLVLLSSFKLMAGDSIKIGWNRQEITTELPVKLPGGFAMRVSKGAYPGHHAYVTALVIDSGKDQLIFLGCDVIGVGLENIERIRRMVLAQVPNFPVKKIIVNATHSHYSGYLDTGGRRGVPKEIEVLEKGEYLNLFNVKATTALVRAWRNRRPGLIAWGYGYAPVGFSRRTIYLDDLSQRPGYEKSTNPVFSGHGCMHGPVRHAMFSHFEAGMDPYAHFIYTFTPKGKLTGAIINCCTTAQCGIRDGSMLSPDFWQEFRDLLEAKYGKEVNFIPQCAAAGDITPRHQLHRAAMKRRQTLKFGKADDHTLMRKEVANLVFNAFEEVLSWAGKDKRFYLRIHHVTEMWDFPIAAPKPEYVALAQKRLKELEENPEKEDINSASQLSKHTFRMTALGKYNAVIRKAKSAEEKKTISHEIHVAHLGPLGLVTCPFELFIDYMHRIQGRSPYEETIVMQLSNGRGGYLPTERAVANSGYSAEPCSFTVSPAGGQMLVDRSVETLNRLTKLSMAEQRKEAKALALAKKAKAKKSAKVKNGQAAATKKPAAATGTSDSKSKEKNK